MFAAVLSSGVSLSRRFVPWVEAIELNTLNGHFCQIYIAIEKPLLCKTMLTVNNT